MKKLWKAAVAGMLSLTMLAGCGGTDKGEKEESSAGKKSEIVIGMGSDIVSLNPHGHNDTGSAYVTRSIYSNLVCLNDDNEFVGDLAESWEQIDGKTISFVLKDAKFSNGEPVTSEDVKYSLEKQKESTNVGHLVEIIDNVEVKDDKNFVIHLNKDSNALLSSLGHSGGAILCKSYCEELEAKGETLEENPMGSGPYKFVEWVVGASIVLEKNEDYFDKDRMAQNDKLTFKIIPEASAGTIALETGEVDMLLTVGTVDAQKIRDNEKLALDEYEVTSLEYFCMNVEKAPFDNVKVRQAINYAIKKDDVMIASIDGEGTVQDSYISPVAIGYYDTGVKYEYNPDKAKELLKEAGLENGFSFTVLSSGEVRSRAAAVIQENLAAVGITMEIEQIEFAAFLESVGNGDHEACMTGWAPNAEPDNSYRPLFKSENAGSGGNSAFYKNEKVDELVDAAAVSMDQDEVDSARGEILKIVSEDAIWVPLYSKTGMIGRNADLQGVKGSPISYPNFYTIHY